jgi:hypothetical protein
MSHTAQIMFCLIVISNCSDIFDEVVSSQQLYLGYPAQLNRTKKLTKDKDSLKSGLMINVFIFQSSFLQQPALL